MPLTTVSQGLLSTDAQYTGFKNRLINGAMVIDQRNAGAVVSAPTSGQFIMDRFQYFATQSSRMSAQQSTVAPNGFVNSALITTTSAFSVGSSDIFGFRQPIEGLNVADLGWGTASAQTVTLSFWVRSSLTGTFGGSLNNGAQDRSYPFTYTISVANTWEQKTLTIAGDTSGTWLTNNGVGIYVSFSLGAGATRSGTAGVWVGSQFYSATGAVSVVGTNGATFYITGVQLEKGSTATSFDYRPYGTELALCQRYFTSNFDIGNAPANSTYGDNRVAIGTIFNNTAIQSSEISFPVTMRAAPSITFFAPSFISTAGRWGIYPVAWGGSGYAPGVVNVGPSRLIAGGDVSGLTNYSSYILSGYYTASAEL